MSPLRVSGVVRRAAYALANLALVFLLCFALLHAMPGDPLDAIESPGIPAAQAERARAAFGLDLPLYLQIPRTLHAYLRGDLGVSHIHRRPVATVIGEALPATAILGAAALALAYLLGIPGGVVTALLGSRARGLVRRVTLVLAIVPRFWFGSMLVLLLSSRAGWLPASHAAPAGGGDLAERIRHLVLPALTLGLPAAAVVARYQLVALLDTLEKPFVRAARAAGTGRARLLLRHALPASLGPTVTLFGLDLSILVSGAVVVEVLFAWPGLGRITTEAVLGADYMLALAATLLISSVVVAGRFVAETVALRVDPQRASGGSGGRR